MTLFLDIDGVAADFSRGYFDMFGERYPRSLGQKNPPGMWKRIAQRPGFFRDLYPLEDFHLLWDHVAKHAPVFLSKISLTVKDSAEQKRAWLDRVVGKHVPAIFCQREDKAVYGKPGDTLVDDMWSNLYPWRSMGGHVVLFKSAAQSIEELKKLGFE